MGDVNGRNDFAWGSADAEIMTLRAPTDISGQLAEVRQTYRRWLGVDYDLQVLDVVLAVAAAEQLGGDPPWLLIVGGSGAAKTETVMPLAAAGGVVVSTISGEAALLSGTPEKEKAADASGGLLRRIGARGLLVVKDFTSVLSMNRDTRALVLAALREIYDGRWSREIGSEGGRSLVWTGRLVLVGAVTTAWDAAHQVISAMGDRFVLVRMDSTTSRRTAGLQALRNVDRETQMRHELGAAVGALLASVPADRNIELDDDDLAALLDLADVVTRARTAVERDYQGNVVSAHAPEMPTRFTKQLAQVVRGGLAIGMAKTSAMEAAARCAGDTMPPLRLTVLLDVARHPMTRTSEVVKRVQLPRKTVDRVLQELHLLGLLVVDDEPWGESVRWVYTLAPDVSTDVVQRLARNVTTPAEEIA